MKRSGSQSANGSQKHSRLHTGLKAGAVVGGIVMGTLLSQNVLAHGYLMKPESRGYACKLGQNSDCGAIIWEPQSLEAPKGFPQSGPADGKIASAAVSLFSPLDTQTASRWTKKTIKSGANSFTWRFTANHVTQGWRYFITKQGWNPNLPLSRNSFDLRPFCSADGGMRQPPMEVTHQCTVPNDRSGYHVILAVWDIGDTVNAFYNVTDVNIENSGGPNPPPWKDIGDINPVSDLAVGDVVRARIFDASGENASLETRITIASVTEGRRNNWPQRLAQAINQEHTNLIAGVMDGAGNIVPALGKNDIYAATQSGILRVEITIEQVSVPVVKLDVTGVKSTYPIVNGQASVDFSVTATGNYTVNSVIHNSSNRLVAQNSTTVRNTSQTVRLTIASPLAGRYSLVVSGTPEKGAVTQKTFSFTLQDSNTNNGYDYIYPQNIQSYKAGTKVLGSDGKVYQCKPFPYSGWCTINAHQYMPGTGSNWQDAWIRIN